MQPLPTAFYYSTEELRADPRKVEELAEAIDRFPGFETFRQAHYAQGISDPFLQVLAGQRAVRLAYEQAEALTGQAMQAQAKQQQATQASNESLIATVAARVTAALQAQAPTLSATANSLDGRSIPYRKSEDIPKPSYGGELIYFQQEEDLTGKRATSKQKAIIAAQCLTDKAQQLWKSAWEAGQVEGSSVTEPKTWEDFQEWIRLNFSEYNSREKALDRLLTLRQTKSVFDYAYIFDQTLTLYPEQVSEGMKRDLFLRGLKPELQQKWYESSHRPSEWQEMIRRLCDFERSLEEGKRYQSRISMVSNDDLGDPMDLSALSALIESKDPPRKNSPAWRPWCKRHNACFQCGSRKHKSSKCEQRDSTDIEAFVDQLKQASFQDELEDLPDPLDPEQQQRMLELNAAGDLSDPKGKEEEEDSVFHLNTAGDNFMLYKATLGTHSSPITMHVLMDSGASHEYINADVVRRLDNAKRVYDPQSVRLPDGSHMSSNYKVSFFLRLGEWCCRIVARELENLQYDVILGKGWLRKHDPQISFWTSVMKLRDHRNKIHTIYPIDLRRKLQVVEDEQQLNLLTRSQVYRMCRKPSTQYVLFLVQAADNQLLSDKIQGYDELDPRVKRVLSKYEGIFRSELPKELPPKRP
ncbi:hypothetical protein VTO42DRAFT_1049 [Malbranchea cinnamomea]